MTRLPSDDPAPRALDGPAEPPDDGGFSAWLWRQQGRPDPVGQLAHVIVRDPFWQGAASLDEGLAHLRRLGARNNSEWAMRRAWAEHEGREALRRRQAKARARKQMAKLARRRNR